jgi:hypothetical protein
LISGVNDLMVPFSGGDWNASLTLPVVVRYKASGPAAARSPLAEAMLRREDEGGGRASDGHEVGSSRTLASPLTAANPSSLVCISCSSGPSFTLAPPVLFVPKPDDPDAAFAKLNAILNLGSSVESDRFASRGEMEDETCGLNGGRVGVEKLKECRGSTVGLQKEGERLWSAILSVGHRTQADVLIWDVKLA